MRDRRWTRHRAPLVLAAGFAAVLGVQTVAADGQPWEPPPCNEPAAAAIGSSAVAPWYRLDAVLDDRLELAGQSLVVGLADGRGVRSIGLEPESFAAGPFGGAVLVGSDDGSASVVRSVDVNRGCAVSIATEQSVIRRATLDPAGHAVYEFRVDRRSRAGLGVWRRDLDGSTRPVRVLPPLPVDDRFGPTFSTELSWSLDGALVITSCGERACRARLLDPATGAVRTLDDPGLGEVIGVADDTAIAYDACAGLPCPIVAVDLGTGAMTTLDADAGGARLVGSAEGPRVVHEIGMSNALRIVRLDGRETGRFTPAAGLRLLPPASRAGASVTTTTGWIPLARDGRVVGPEPGSASLRSLDTGRLAPLQEVVR